MLFPRFSSGLVVLAHGADVSVGGSCVAYRRPDVVITAAHCVPASATVFVHMPGDTALRQVQQAARHPSVDVAVLGIESREVLIPDAFVTELANDLIDGGDFTAFGYPMESTPQGQQPTGRIMRGHWQRFFGYTNAAGRNYFAGEMSIPAPGGMSGGPVLRGADTNLLEGIVTTNHDSFAILDQVDDVDDDGARTRIESRRIVSYGIAVMSVVFREWLDDLHTENW